MDNRVDFDNLINFSPVFLYCDSITLPKCPRPNTLSNRNESIVKPIDDGNCDDD